MTDPKDALTLARQMSCGKHPGSIIKHVSDSIARCPFCGVSQGDWEAMESDMQLAMAPTPGQPSSQSPSYPWGYNYPQGNNPYPGNGNNSSKP